MLVFFRSSRTSAGPAMLAVQRGLKDSFKGGIETELEVDVDIDWYFGCLKEFHSHFKYCLTVIAALMVLILMVLKSGPFFNQGPVVWALTCLFLVYLVVMRALLSEFHATAPDLWKLSYYEPILWNPYNPTRISFCTKVDSGKLEHERRMICAAIPSAFGKGLEDDHVPNIWLLL